MSAKRRFAIAGLGAAARQIHLPALRSLPEAALVGACDPAVEATGFAFPVFASLDELLEKARPEILVVATPPQEHFAQVKRGLLAGCDVVCEKPFTTSLEDAGALIALARQNGRRIVVNNQYRLMEIHREARRRIGSAEFGELLFLSAQQTFHTSALTEAGWRGQQERRTCLDFGTHVLDLCRFFFGEDPCALAARMPRPGRAGGPDYLNLIRLEFSRDRVAHVLLDRISRGPHRYLSFRLDGSQGCIETEIGGGLELHAGIAGGTRRPYLHADLSWGGRARLYHGASFVKIASEPLDGFARATRRLVEAFLASLESGETPPCDAEDNRRTLALMLAAYESAEKGGARIEMEY